MSLYFTCMKLLIFIVMVVHPLRSIGLKRSVHAREVPISAAEELSTKSSFSICCIKLEQTILSFFFIYVLYIDVIEFITGPRPTYSLEMFFPAAYEWNVNCYSAIQQLQLCTPPKKFQRRFFYFLRNDKIFFIWDRVQRKRLKFGSKHFCLEAS